MLIGLVIVLAIAANAVTPLFLTAPNISDALSNLSEKALMLLPLVPLIIAREIDLSVASIAGLASVSLGAMFEAKVPLAVAIVVVVVIGALCGLLNGVLVSVLGLPSLVVTLGTLGLYRGLCYVVLSGKSVAGFPAWFTNFGFGYIPGTLIPQPLVIVVVAAVIFGVWLHLTTGGREVYAIGNGSGAARFSGLPVRSLLVRLYVVSGTFSAIAGVIYSARFASARADSALGFELDVIAAALLGGVSMAGGVGSIFGGLLGLTVLGVVRNAMSLANISSEVQSVVVGALLILAVLLTTLLSDSSRLKRAPSRAVRKEVAADA